MERLDQQLFEERVGTNWFNYLHKFFESKEAYDIYQVLKSDAKNSVISPSSMDIWRFLTCMDPNNVKVVLIGLDPYPGRYSKKLLHSTGIPFDCANSPDGKLQPSLTEFWNGISAEFEDEMSKEKDLQFLLNQGLFLGNRGLTCRLFQTESHIPLWDPFWKVFFEEYISLRPGVPIIFCGKSAEKLKKYVSFNRVFSITHPSFAARTGQVWDTQNVFSSCNKIIRDSIGKEFMIDYNFNNIECPF